MFLENIAWNKNLLVHLENAQSKQQRHIERQDASYVYIPRRKVSLIQNEHQREQNNEQPKQEKRNKSGNRVVQLFLVAVQDVNQLLFTTFKAHFLEAFEQGAFVIEEADKGIFFFHIPKIKSNNLLQHGFHDKFMTKMRFFTTKNKFNFCEPLSNH